jgi:hypothetical protein
MEPGSIVFRDIQRSQLAFVNEHCAGAVNGY